jgi:hypothetical protein
MLYVLLHMLGTQKSYVDIFENINKFRTKIRILSQQVSFVHIYSRTKSVKINLQNKYRQVSTD